MASIDELFDQKKPTKKEETKDKPSSEVDKLFEEDTEKTVPEEKPEVVSETVDEVSEASPVVGVDDLFDESAGTSSQIETPTVEESEEEKGAQVEQAPPLPPLPTSDEQILENLLKNFPKYTKEQLDNMVKGEIAKAGGLLTYEAAASIVGSDLLQKQEQKQEPPIVVEETDDKATSIENLFAGGEAKVVQEKPVTGLTTEDLFQQSGVRADLPLAEVPTVIPEFDIKPVTKGQACKIFMIYGYKGDSKTTLALSFPGKISALSFDRKTAEIWEEMYNLDPRIIVYDAILYIDYSSPEAWLRSSDISLRYVDALLEQCRQDEPDWIFIDAIDGFIKMAEMTMRYRNNLAMTAGVSWPFWKERRLYIKQLHLKATEVAKKGVIYSAYVGKREEIKDNKIVESTEEPKWIDVIKEQTDVVIRVKSRQEETGRKFVATVESSKWGPIMTGARVDITVEPGQVPDCLQRIVTKSRR